jgi:ATP-dependent DNA helicase RecQ
LRKLRREIATREGVPPYIIFADSTLHEMSQYKPTESKALLAIKGIGESKLEKYGSLFINAIQQHLRESPNVIVTPEPIRFEISGKNKAAKGEIPSHMVTYNRHKDGLSVVEIAKERNLTVETIENHLIRCDKEGHNIDWDAIIPKEFEAQILAQITELGSEKLKPLKEALPEEVSYSAIIAGLSKYKK